MRCQPISKQTCRFIAKLMCYFLTCYLFWGQACYLQWVQRGAAHSDQIITFQYNCTCPAICNCPTRAKNSKAKSSAVAQCSMTSVRWKYYACGAQSWRKIWKPAERPVGICQLPSVSLWAGSELSVGRGRAFSFSLLPLSWRSFSSVQGFLHGTA